MRVHAGLKAGIFKGQLGMYYTLRENHSEITQSKQEMEEHKMVGQMSSKSKIYHRSGCRYIKKIDEQSLVTFDFDDDRIKELEPCKCCCSLKKIYDNYKPNLRTVSRQFSPIMKSKPVPKPLRI